MEQALGIIGFSFGASLGIGAVRQIAGGSRPLLRDVFKMGIRVWDGVAGAAASGGEDAAQAPEPAARRGRRRAAPQKIVIARS